MKAFWLLLLGFPLAAFAQEKSENVELLGHMGGRPALMHLYSTPREDGSARLTGDYVVLPTMQQRFLEGDRSKQLGVTVLREGNSAILYGRPALATLQGTWSGGVLKGQRFGPEGQERERFEFSENFPSMDGYGASVKCEMREGRYRATLSYAIEGGTLKSFDWRSQVAPENHTCSVSGLQQRGYAGGLQFVAGRCRVTMRDLGELVRVTAEDCAEFCGSQAYLEPVLVDKRGGCSILRPQARQ
ncbi:MAG TPA: hypothetical protein VN747_00400 [Burkholderiales bacterium]|jgi:hypothetical protein|nr:hypothetical protein [Burkholderiales bacterium]